MTRSLLPLFPSAHVHRFAMDNSQADKHDAEFRLVRPSVLARDGHACRHCGFVDRGSYMQVHHIDHEHSNNGIDNLAAVCLHCHAVHHVGLWGAAATVVWLPELSQAEVSHLSRAMLVAAHAANATLLAASPVPMRRIDDILAMDRAAQRIAVDLEGRAAIATRELGIANGRDLAHGLMVLPEDAYRRREEMLAPFRIVLNPELAPHSAVGRLHDRLPGFVDGWLSADGAFGGIGPETWTSMLAFKEL